MSIFIASEKLILVIACVKIGRALVMAFSAPAFMASMVLSSSFPMAALRIALPRIFCSRFLISCGNSILYVRLCANPPGFMRPSVPFLTPLLRASFSPCPASSWDKGFGAAIFAFISEILFGTVMGGMDKLQAEIRAIIAAMATVLDTCILQR